ncbi:MAG: PAS domain S-box protein [Bacteroidota bacterium]
MRSLPPDVHTGSVPKPDVEHALMGVSRLLVSSTGADLHQVLELLGQALEARCAYFTFVAELDLHTPETAILQGKTAPTALPSGLLGETVSWTHDGAPMEPLSTDILATVSLIDSDPTGRVCLIERDDDSATFAVPLLTEDSQFVGYFGFERERAAGLSESYGRVLSILGDVLGSHLSRLAAEEARQQTEERWQRLVDRHPDAILVTVGGAIMFANDTAVRFLGAPDAETLCSLSFRDVLSADDEEAVSEGQAIQLADESPRPFEHVIIRLDGDERIVESLSVPFPGVPGAIQTVLRDVTERKENEERYRTFVETISEGVWRIDLDEPISRDVSARAQAEHILAKGRLAELNPAMARLFWPHAIAPIGAFIGTLMVYQGMPLFRTFVDAGHRLHNHEVAFQQSKGPTRYFSVNAVGQFDRGELCGVWGSCTEITDRVEMERSMVAALEDQQERIGRDLHDSVGQLLTGVRMLSDSLATRYDGREGADTAARVGVYAAEALDRVRAICRGLVPPQLYNEGAATALAELVTHVDALGPTRCVYRHDGRADLHAPDAALQLYRIAQEALSNALKHAQAETVWVYFGYDDDDLVMEIEDDGRGFVLDAQRARSIGLYSMMRRAHSTGASLVIETRPGAGTTVRVSIPRAFRRYERPVLVDKPNPLTHLSEPSR